MLEYLFMEYEVCLREARLAYRRVRSMKTASLWKGDVCARVCRARQEMGEVGMEIVL